MPTAQIIQLDHYRQLTPSQKFLTQKEKLKQLLADCTPVPTRDPILDDLEGYIERAAERRTEQDRLNNEFLLAKINSLERQLAAFIQQQGGQQ